MYLHSLEQPTAHRDNFYMLALVMSANHKTLFSTAAQLNNPHTIHDKYHGRYDLNLHMLALVTSANHKTLFSTTAGEQFTGCI